ncbi:MAG TPA: hypothetical protein VEJ20_03380, partial [Candidatus Eremiobacteraceae bacterium]|nr:hypothetical protein [Candidatus Eremiobacteraceae bacterium]
MLAPPIAARADAPAITYDLSMSDPAAHVFSIEMRIEHLHRAETTVRMPIWIPGDYSDDQYGRNVFDFDARDAAGNAVSWTRDGQSAYVL